MKFVLVNGRTPSPRAFCMQCCVLIGSSYLREIATEHPYCDYQCYSLYRESVEQPSKNRASAGSRIAS